MWRRVMVRVGFALALAIGAGAAVAGAPKIAAGSGHSLAIDTAGRLLAWGSDKHGQLGVGRVMQSDHPLPVSITGAIKVASSDHNLMLKSDGSLWAWGNNGYGQLGDGTRTDRSTPVQIGTGFSAIAGGWWHSLALKVDGSLWAWGDNEFGQLGVGSLREPAPVRVGTGFSAIAAGLVHSLALKADGSLWAWGWNLAGQLGDGTDTNRLTPVQIGTGFSAIAAGLGHSLALKADGSLWAWGYNRDGQIGDGQLDNDACSSFLCVMYPKQIGTGFSAIAAGWEHSLALKADGSLWAWGGNGNGQIGDDQLDNDVCSSFLCVTYPKQIGTGFSAIAAGDYHSLALKADGSLWAWGASGWGELGDGTFTNAMTPQLAVNDTLTGILDLDPATPNSIPREAIPKLLVATRKDGDLKSLSLSGRIHLGAIVSALTPRCASARPMPNALREELTRYSSPR